MSPYLKYCVYRTAGSRDFPAMRYHSKPVARRRTRVHKPAALTPSRLATLDSFSSIQCGAHR